MAARIENFFDETTKKAVLDCKLLVVGAGGIGCELLKNLVLSGFEDIHVIDLDTIDVSNLNRQFLFQKQHVGKAKAEVAKESAQKLNPKCEITAYHDSITNSKYDVKFFQQFSAVTNALDNMAARSHVNRMCLAADVPLIESGSAGYLGQVTVYKKAVTECYECLPKAAAKTFPGCTIRNTPSETIHCVVWAKHLYNQLFGEEDADEEVSPDAADKELGSEFRTSETGNIVRFSTRDWAKTSKYDAIKIFNKLFHEDIKYLLSMTDLWVKRKPPIMLDWENLPDAVASSSTQIKPAIKDQELWSIQECATVFSESLIALKRKLDDPQTGSKSVLLWDKDDKHCMDFVASCANIRAHCFGIPQKNRFSIKSMAGNIIPAIATTNAVIGGLIVLELFKVLKGQIDRCRTVILSKCASGIKKNLLAPCRLSKPNPKCFACSIETPTVYAKLNVKTLTKKTLEEKILIEQLNMVEPDVVVDDGRGTILISSDPLDREGVDDKPLSEFKINYGSRLQCDDFFQRFKLVLIISHGHGLLDQEFELVGDLDAARPEENNDDSESLSEKNPPSENTETETDVLPSFDDDGDIKEVEPEHLSVKRKVLDDENGTPSPSKKPRLSSDCNDVGDGQ